uniref:MRH domain-containing protein n=1 Tax=Steinernema glaseri TaxID=37863 RepID=A0A1I7YAX9_9BILA
MLRSEYEEVLIKSCSCSKNIAMIKRWSNFLRNEKTVLHCALVVLPATTWAIQCEKGDFVYEYLNCDNEGKRWRVAVPRSHQLKCDNVPPPVVGINCSTFFLPGGTLPRRRVAGMPTMSTSLGGGIRYDEFEKGFPSGFSVENYIDDTEAILHGDLLQETCSPSAGWVIQNSELRYMPTTCVSKLSIQVHLVTAGYIEIVYRMPRESRGLLLNINVKNEQCQTNRLEDALANGHTNERQSKEWQMKRVNLRTGQNVVSLTVSNNRELTTLADVIYVAKIDIVGIAFTKTCTKCPAGTYSDNAATVCTPCNPGFFSRKGSSHCSKCTDSSFSGPKAAKCRPKPPCQKIDFYKKFDTCSNNEMSVRYIPFQPNVCNDDVPSSYIKPSPRREKCAACSIGMYRDSSGQCRFCSEGQYSEDGTEKSIPNSGYFYNRWESMPANMETGCEFVSQEEVNNCHMDDAWVPQGEYIQSSTTRSNDVVLELVVNVSTGFKNYLQPEGIAHSVDNPVAFIEFEFETICADLSCTLYFVADPNPKSKRGIFQVIGIFNGTQSRQKFRHPIIGKKPARFIFAFIRSGIPTGESIASDLAKIYALNITNVERKNQQIGADRCLSCPMFDVKEKVCHPCPPGHYIDVNENRCVQCPYRSILNMTSTRSGIESCLKCGPNLVADKNHVECVFDGELHIADEQNKTVKYDLSGLRNKSLSANGIRVFAREGNSYYHGYNLTIFGGMVPCREQFKDSMFGLSTLDQQSSDVMASVCRSTALPMHKENGTAVESAIYVSPAPLAQRLVAVTTDHTFGTVTLTDKDMEYDTISEKNRPTDIHFYYEPIQSSLIACRNGTAAVITVRCDPHAANLVARLPKSCPDGTCDGCLYHIIIETSMACPICEKNDFDVIKGECVDGKQTIHSIPSRHCILSGALSKERIEPCSVISANMQLLFAVLGTLTVALVISILVICQRNRSLEYKYMKLVESKVGSNGIELPMAESCALGSDEDEEEETSSTRVFFGRKGKNDVYASLKSKSNRAGPNRDDASASSFLNASAD